MSRLLLLVFVFGLIYLAFKYYAKSSSTKADSVDAEDMVCCARCGVHLPKSQSINSDGKFFCCQSHLSDDAG
jgi:uncharacterized protein